MQLRTKLLSKERFILTALLAAGSAGAAPFSYTTGDLLIGFRRTASEPQIVIDAGPAANFSSLPSGTVITIANNLTPTITGQLANLNSVSWSAFAHMLSLSGSYPNQTLWLTAPCADQFTPGPAWQRDSADGQAGVGGQVEALGAGCATYCSQNPGASGNFTATSVAVPASALNSQKYGYYVDNAVGFGNFNNNFGGNVENTTRTNFTTAGVLARSSLYLLQPGSGAGQYLGYFLLSPGGTMTFTAAPAITQFQFTLDDSGNVSFPTVIGASYKVYASPDASARFRTWTLVGSPVMGDGNTQSVQDPSAYLDQAGFYRVKAQ